MIMATVELFHVWELILASGFKPEIHCKYFCTEPV